MKEQPYKISALAFDLGASSGKAFIGEFDHEKLYVKEVHRFSNDPVRAGERLHWDILRLLYEIKHGIVEAGKQGYKPQSMGIDSWAIDFGLLAPSGELLSNPVHYRDARTDGIMEVLELKLGRAYIFERSGIQFLPFNTLYQLYAMMKANATILKCSDCLLMIPDLLRYFLTGEKKNEFTNATTTQLFNPTTMSWDADLLASVGLKADLFPEMVRPGSKVGTLLPSVCLELGITPFPVVAVGEHDTASAVVAVPATSDDFAYISCGTWSLIGTELPRPNLSPEALEWNFTNEGGVADTFRFLKNVMGLWLVQECKRCWEQEGHAYSFEQLVAMAETASAFRSLIDPDDTNFLHPPNMPEAIRSFCHRTGQPVPDDHGAVMRCVMESLALKYRFNLEQIEKLTGKKYPGIHMVGGGVQNRMLCRFTAEALGRPVWAGPVEGSAIGNLLVQFMAFGHIADLKHARAIVRDSFSIHPYIPENAHDWDRVYETKFIKILNLSKCRK